MAGFRIRTVVTGCIVTILCVSAGVAGQPGVQAEWPQRYDPAERLAVPRGRIPVLSRDTVAATKAAILHYADLVARGGWPTVPLARVLRLGVEGPDVMALRRRLEVTDDLTPDPEASAVFDAYVEAGVRRFQARHGIGETGVVARETATALNIPASARLKQLQLNLVRLTTLGGDLSRRFAMANIPAAEVEAVEDGRVRSRHVAGVGKADRQSPVLQAETVAINFNPYWHVPASIIRKDLIPKMRTDSHYLADNHIHIYDESDREIAPDSVDWSTDMATRYKFREDPGLDNSMGVVRINIDNPYGVYMHDTATKGIFGDDFRFISSGCIRIQNVRDYVTWLLEDTPGWDRPRIDAAIRSGGRIDAKLATPVPVYWVYLTAWATPDGAVEFRDDIYGKDGLDVPPTLTMARPAEPVASSTREN